MHFTRVKCKITKRSALVKALERMNKNWIGKIEVNDEAQHLYGYQGDQREQKAEIIVRRKLVGGSSNDIGFKLQEDGTYEAIISEYDSTRYNKKWLQDLEQGYGAETVIEVADSMGYEWEETRVGDEIHIECQVMSY